MKDYWKGNQTTKELKNLPWINLKEKFNKQKTYHKANLEGVGH